MKFFIDFEAAQYTEEIISIGCVNENGNTFKTLVRPAKDHSVGKFITELTGITDEMVKDAPSADEAFLDFFTWVRSYCGDTSAEYYCYGDTDTVFLLKTARYMKDFMALTFIHALRSQIKDYSVEVKQFFSSGSIALWRVFSLIQKEEVIQRHDALEDAVMLKEVFNNLIKSCSPTDKTNLPAPVHHEWKNDPKKSLVPELYKNWPEKSPEARWQADTLGTESNYTIKAVWNNDTNRIKYFDSVSTAAMWLIKYYAKNRSVKNKAHMKDMEKAIMKCDNYYGFTWTKKEV